mgnify:CR=1 FL=1
MSKKRIGVIFGGKSGEHEVSLMSATSVIRAIDPEKFDVVMLGITRQGQWLLYEGPLEALIPGEWQAKAEEDLRRDPARFSLCILGNGANTLVNRIDFALPILHGPNGEDGTVQGLLELLDIPYGGCGVLVEEGCDIVPAGLRRANTQAGVQPDSQPDSQPKK